MPLSCTVYSSFGQGTTTCIATSTKLAWTIGGTLFNGFFSLINQIMPYAIGILIFYIGYRLARRALAGR